MLTLESKTALVKGNQEAVYNYIADFNNFAHLLPAERLQDIQVTGNSLTFSIAGLGTVGLKYAEKHPWSKLIINAIEGTSADFTFLISIAETPGNTSQVQIILEANLNMFLEMMARGPLQQFLEIIVEKMEEMQFP